MSEVVTALHRFDLPVAQAFAAERGAKVFLADPALHARALAAGVTDLVVHTSSKADVARAAYAQAQRSTQALSRELGAQLKAIAPKAVEGCWNAHRIAQMFLTLHGYQRIWQDVLDQHVHAHWHVLLPQQAHAYGTHSFVPGLQLLNQLRERGIAFGAFGYDCPGMDAYQLPDLRRISPDTELLVHLPTCRYDAAHFAAEILATGQRAGVLTSQLYDEPLDGLASSGLVSLSEVRECLGPQRVARVQALEPALRAVLVTHLHPHIPQQRFLDLQVQALWEALEAQALLYLWLEQHFSTRAPRQLLISNHDATIHGALTSFALQGGADVIVVPHSRVHNQTIKLEGARPLCLHHGLQDGPSLDIGGRVLGAGLLAYPAAPAVRRDARPLRTLGLVLNGISGNGMCLVNFEHYLDGIRQLLDWARLVGLAVKLRVRIAETPTVLLVERLGLDMDELMRLAQGSLLDFARGCDLCVGYDMPTSGLQDLLQQGLPVMQAEVRPLSWPEWSIVDGRVVPRHGLPELMDRLELLKASTEEFMRFADRQYRIAQEAVAGARPLSAWLLRANEQER